jgi:hypothetical protein
MIGRTDLKGHKETSGQHKLFLENPIKYKKMRDRLKNEKIDNPKYKCECGSELKNQTSVIKKHKKTQKHLNLMKLK